MINNYKNLTEDEIVFVEKVSDKGDLQETLHGIVVDVSKNTVSIRLEIPKETGIGKQTVWQKFSRLSGQGLDKNLNFTYRISTYHLSKKK